MNRTQEAIKRVQEGDHSPDALAQLGAYYMRVYELVHMRHDQLMRLYKRDELIGRFKELDIETLHDVNWFSMTRSTLAAHIAEVEYPYLDALEETLIGAGVDIENFRRIPIHYIEQAVPFEMREHYKRNP